MNGGPPQWMSTQGPAQHLLTCHSHFWPWYSASLCGEVKPCIANLGGALRPRGPGMCGGLSHTPFTQPSTPHCTVQVHRDSEPISWEKEITFCA